MNKYVTPQVEVTFFATEDIITSSIPGVPSGPNLGPNMPPAG